MYLQFWWFLWWVGPALPDQGGKKEHNWEHNLGQNYFREEKIPKKHLNNT